MGKPIRGQTRELATPINVDFNAKIHNRFDIEVIDSRTGKIRQKAVAYNVVCNNFYKMVFANPYGQDNTPAQYICYGSGTGTPAATDTALFTQISSVVATSDGYTVDWSNHVACLKKHITLSETTAVGKTLTEVGFATYGYGITTHAMLKDMNGNQISIAKTETDIINIYATVFLHWPETLYNGDISLSIDNTNYPSTTNPPGIIKWLLGGTVYEYSYSKAYYGQSYNYSQYNVALSTHTYDETLKKETIVYARLAASSGNVSGGIEYVNVVSGIWIKPGNTAIPASNITTEAIGTGDGTTTDFCTDFDCPQNSTIYVDGTAATGVTVYPQPISNNIAMHLTQQVTIGNITHQEPGILTRSTFYNPYHECGVKSVNHTDIQASNDGITWVNVSKTVEAAYRNYKYWRISPTSGNSYYSDLVMTAEKYAGANIHFDTAPVSGAVITADYTTPRIAKDTNHVFDLTLTLQLGEYTA